MIDFQLVLTLDLTSTKTSARGGCYGVPKISLTLHILQYRESQEKRCPRGEN